MNSLEQDYPKTTAMLEDWTKNHETFVEIFESETLSKSLIGKHKVGRIITITLFQEFFDTHGLYCNIYVNPETKKFLGYLADSKTNTHIWPDLLTTETRKEMIWALLTKAFEVFESRLNEVS